MAPSISQSLYNLNKTKYAPDTNIRRGVVIPTRDKSSGFSIAGLPDGSKMDI